jgi:hypothetical protein
MLVRDVRRFFRYANAASQERRALARRACDWTNVVRNVLETHLQARSETTGGLRPPLLRCCANVRRRKTIFAVDKRRFNQERRASARRGSVIRTSCGQNRAMFGD